MKASEIKPGMVIDGWTVTARVDVPTVGVRGGEFMGADGPFTVTEHYADCYDTVVLVTLEREWVRHYGEHGSLPEPVVQTETRRTWYAADEEVSCELA